MKTLETVILSIVAVLAPIKTALIATLVLIFLDLITGVLAARKTGTTITSAGLSRTAAKLFVYYTIIIAGFITEQYLTGDILPVSKITTAFVGATELISVSENLNIISGTNLLQSFIDKLSSKNLNS